MLTLNDPFGSLSTNSTPDAPGTRRLQTSLVYRQAPALEAPKVRLTVRSVCQALGVWLAISFISLSILAVFGSVSGCPSHPPAGAMGGDPLPDTHFTPPPKTEPVGPPVKDVANAAGGVRDGVAEGGKRVEKSTPKSFEKDKPNLLKFFSDLKQSADELVFKASVAVKAAEVKDQNVVDLTKLVLDARDTVSEREKLLVEQRKDYEARIVELTNKLTASNAEARKDLNRMLVSSVAFGGVLIIGGIVALIWVKPQTIGAMAIGAGMAVSSLAMGAIYFGREMAMIAVSVGVIGVVTLIVVVIKFLRGDLRSVAQGVAQARLAGKMDLGDKADRGSIASIFDMAQTPGAKAVIDAETK